MKNMKRKKLKQKKYQKPYIEKIKLKLNKQFYASSGGGCCCGGGGSCFVEGTKVLTKEGLKPIEKLTTEDMVISYNFQDGKTEYKLIERTIKYKNKEILEIILNNGETIQVSSTHPFYTLRGKIRTGELQIGDKLFALNGHSSEIIEIKKYVYTHPIVTYNLTVKGNHNYVVGENRVVVGNKNEIQ